MATLNTKIRGRWFSTLRPDHAKESEMLLEAFRDGARIGLQTERLPTEVEQDLKQIFGEAYTEPK